MKHLTNNIIRAIALLGILSVAIYHISNSPGYSIELKQGLLFLIFLTIPAFFAGTFFRREVKRLFRFPDLIVPLCFLITIQEIARFGWGIAEENESLKLKILDGRVAYLPFSTEEIIGLIFLILVGILSTAWTLRLIFQVEGDEETNLSVALINLKKDWWLTSLGMGIGFGFTILIPVTLSILAGRIYLFSALLGLICFIWNLISAPLLPLLLKSEKSFFKTVSDGLLKTGPTYWKIWLLPVFLHTLILGVNVGVPTNFFQLLANGSIFLTESRFFWLIKDLWIGDFPNSIQWFLTVASWWGESISPLFYLLGSIVMVIFAVIIKLRIVYKLLEILSKDSESS